MTQMHRLPTSTRGLLAYEVALELVRAVRPLLPKLERFDSNLADQVRRAVTGCPLHVAEAKRRTGKDRAHLLTVALGSSGETQAGLQTAEALGGLTLDEIRGPVAIADRLNGLLFGYRRKEG